MRLYDFCVIRCARGSIRAGGLAFDIASQRLDGEKKVQEWAYWSRQNVREPPISVTSVLCNITWFVHVLQCSSREAARKELYTLAVSPFDIPGDPGFPLNNMYAKPQSRSEGGIEVFCYPVNVWLLLPIWR